MQKKDSKRTAGRQEGRQGTTLTSRKGIRELVLRGLTLTEYDWADVENGLIKNLRFGYRTLDGTEGTINLGDIEADLYMDCGDVCVDLFDGLYILDGSIEEYIDDFLESCPELTADDIPPVETEFGWDEFCAELMDYYDE